MKNRCQEKVSNKYSVPEDKDFLASQGVLSLVDMLSEVLSVVGNLSPQVVDQEWFREVVLVIRVGHSLEVEGHSSTALDITNLVLSSGRVAISVEELGHGLTVLGEERVLTICLPLLIEVNYVVGLRAEESAKLLISEDMIKNVNLINGGLGSLISNSCCRDERGGEEVNFPERCMREHHEGEASISDQAACPHVVAAVKARSHLVEVVTSAHAPFPVVRVDHVSHVGSLCWVSLSFSL